MPSLQRSTTRRLASEPSGRSSKRRTASTVARVRIGSSERGYRPPTGHRPADPPRASNECGPVQCRHYRAPAARPPFRWDPDARSGLRRAERGGGVAVVVALSVAVALVLAVEVEAVLAVGLFIAFGVAFVIAIIAIVLLLMPLPALRPAAAVPAAAGCRRPRRLRTEKGNLQEHCRAADVPFMTARTPSCRPPTASRGAPGTARRAPRRDRRGDWEGAARAH